MFLLKHLGMLGVKKIVVLNKIMDNKDSKNIEDIKKLLILGLISRGVQGKDIAQVLGVNKSTITRLVPSRKIKAAKDE